MTRLFLFTLFVVSLPAQEISLTFDDGTVNWLPNRVFSPEKQRFVRFRGEGEGRDTRPSRDGGRARRSAYDGRRGALS